MKRTTPFLVFCTLALTGCGSLGVGLGGYLPGARIKLAPGRSIEVSSLGTPKLNGKRLRLPEASEVDRFGVSFIDLGQLPAAWRPKHAEQGGTVVASIYRASPLAVAGLRPFDLIVSIDGAKVHSPQAAADALRKVPLGQVTELTVVHRDGQRKELSATARTELNEGAEWHLPFSYTSASNQHETALSIGPLDGLFWYADTLQTQTWTYYRRVRWGTLLNLIHWQSVTNQSTGDVERTLRLLWIIPISF